jgi:hypothetical protein
MHDAGLSSAARLLLVHLSTSPTQTPIGVVELASTRWATLTALDVSSIDEAVDELEQAGFLVVDHRLGEVLVRGFFETNHGHVYGASRRDEARAVISPTVRAAAIGR